MQCYRSRTCITHNIETVSKPSCKGFRLYLNKVHKAAVDAFAPLFKLFISPPPLPPPPPPPPPTLSTPTPPILLSLEANICAELLISRQTIFTYYRIHNARKLKDVLTRPMKIGENIRRDDFHIIKRSAYVDRKHFQSQEGLETFISPAHQFIS
uniref:Uncharacterized protein n=1 Tax=Glossina austeni TaxID=7395 RepID=A0A1A9VWQ1_GLOAU